ncbi:hypothetical protein GCM10027589_06440 [Actinocorallia lasiicapitis]
MNYHALITIKNGDEMLSTHQFGGVGLPRNGVEVFDPATLPSTTINVRVPLPNPEAAMAYAEVMMDKTARGVYPAYSLGRQSCHLLCTSSASGWDFRHPRRTQSQQQIGS